MSSSLFIWLGELGQVTKFNFPVLYVCLFVSLNGGNTVLLEENNRLRKMDEPLTVAIQEGRKCSLSRNASNES